MSAPGGAVVAFEAADAPPRLTLGDLEEALGGVPEGSYTWEVTAIQTLDAAGRDAVDGARRDGTPVPAAIREAGRGLRQRGAFRVTDGGFVYDPDAVEPGTERDALETPEALRAVPVSPGRTDLQTFDTQHPTGFTNGFGVRDSLCVGADCQTQEDYGNDTIRLKEENLRIKLQDSTTSSGFPTRDWELVANDTGSGALEHFSIYDVDGAATPFTVEAASPESSLYVDDSGRVGFGTATPSQALHVVTGDTPTLRFEQDGSLGYTAASWNLGGNETNFFLRDESDGQTPFFVRQGAGGQLLVLTDGKIGVGMANPQDQLHVRSFSAPLYGQVFIQNAGSVGTHRMIQIRNLGPPEIGLHDDYNAKEWVMRTQTDGLAFDDPAAGSGQNEVRFDSAGVVYATTYVATSSRALKENFKALDARAVLDRVLGLSLTEWNYKAQDDSVRHIGPMAEDFRAAFGLGVDSATVSTLDVGGVALVAIQGLHEGLREANRELRRENDALRDAQADLATRLAALEARLDALALVR